VNISPGQSRTAPRADPAGAMHQGRRRIRLLEMEADRLEIWMIAGLLVDAHGSRAVAIAKARAERARLEQDPAENAVWHAVMSAAETYLHNARLPAIALNSDTV
jgi:hypothetical protein